MSALQLVVDVSDDGETMVVGAVADSAEATSLAGTWLARAMIEKDVDGRGWITEGAHARFSTEPGVERVAWRCELRRAEE